MSDFMIDFPGAQLAEGVVQHFGDAAAELQAAASGNTVTPLLNLRVLHFSGDDAESFLQSQLSCDIKAIGADGATYGGYCMPQGRLLATFLVWREADGFAMLLSADIAASIQRRLQMFVLRAKVKITDTERLAFALSGPAAIAALTGLGLPPADMPLRISAQDGRVAIRLPQDRHMLISAPEKAAQDWNALSAALRPVGTPAWTWQEIVNGVPWITAATQEQFVPQMVNLEVIGGVSFQKGCYPGQEIVARTQYRGRTRRRMHLANVAAEARAGMELHADSLGNQACGSIVSAAPAPQGGWDVLAVLHPEALQGSIHLGELGGPVLNLRPLPYALPEDSGEQ